MAGGTPAVSVSANDRLRQFLKTYSSVPNAFIDDMFDMVGETMSQTDLVVDLDKAAKWLGTHKFKLLQTLRRSYVDDIDFSVTADTIPKRYGGNRHLTVRMSPDCFKRVCMRTASARGELVRTYFLAIEDLLKRYTDQLLDGIRADVVRLERAQKGPSEKLAAGYIYVIRAAGAAGVGDRDLYKVGRSKDLAQRLRTYRTGRLDDVEVLFKYRTENLKAVEGCIKAALGDNVYQSRREVFRADLDLIKGIVSRCASVSSWKQEYARRKQSTVTGGTYIVVDRLE